MKSHTVNFDGYPACNTSFKHDCRIAECNEKVTCKKCKKILKKEKKLLDLMDK